MPAHGPAWVGMMSRWQWWWSRFCGVSFPAYVSQAGLDVDCSRARLSSLPVFQERRSRLHRREVQQVENPRVGESKISPRQRDPVTLLHIYHRKQAWKQCTSTPPVTERRDASERWCPAGMGLHLVTGSRVTDATARIAFRERKLDASFSCMPSVTESQRVKLASKSLKPKSRVKLDKHRAAQQTKTQCCQHAVRHPCKISHHSLLEYHCDLSRKGNSRAD